MYIYRPICIYIVCINAFCGRTQIEQNCENLYFRLQYNTSF